MPIQVDGVVRVTAVLNFNDISEMQNVFYVRNAGTGAVAEADVRTAAAAWLDGAYDTLDTKLVTEVKFKEIRFYDITGDEPILPEDWPTLVAGGTVGEAMPLNAAAIVSFPTNTKRSIGRKYLSGFDRSFGKNGGGLEVTLVTDLDSWGTAILAGFTADTQGFEVGNWRPATTTFVPWATFRTRSIMGTQKRRRIGVGA